MATELVETARLFARDCAVIEPDWVEPVAGHLVRRTYSEPRWNATRGQVEATEKVTLYGIPLVAARTVGYARVDPGLSRELFLRHALVERDWESRHAFLAANEALMAEVREIEERTRRRDVVVDDTAVYAFYDARVPADVVSARHFDAWWKQARHETPDLLTMTRADVMTGAGGGAVVEQFPDTPRRPAPGRHRRAGAVVRVLPRRPGRRRDGHRARAGARRGRRRRARLARPGPARGAGDRAGPVAAQGAAPLLRPGPGPRDARAAAGLARRLDPARPGRRRGGPRAHGARRPGRAAGRPRRGRAALAPAPARARGRRRREGPRRGPGRRRSCGGGCRPGRRTRCRGRRRRWSGAGSPRCRPSRCPTWSSGRWPGTRSGAGRAGWTRGRRSGSGCSSSAPPPSPPTTAASAGP